MGLRNLLRLVRAIERTDLSLAGHTALEFFAKLLPGDLLRFIRARAEQNPARDGERGEDAFHLLTVKTGRVIARKCPLRGVTLKRTLAG